MAHYIYIIRLAATGASETVWAPEVFRELQRGSARFGFSAFEGADLTQLQEKVKRSRWAELNPIERECWSHSAFLLDVKSGDYLVFVDVPEKDVNVIAEVTGHYAFSAGWGSGQNENFRHTLSCRFVGAVHTSVGRLPTFLSARTRDHAYWRRVPVNEEFSAFVHEAPFQPVEELRDDIPQSAPAAPAQPLETAAESLSSTPTEEQKPLMRELTKKGYKQGYLAALKEFADALSGNSVALESLKRKLERRGKTVSFAAPGLPVIQDKDAANALAIYRTLRFKPADKTDSDDDGAEAPEDVATVPSAPPDEAAQTRSMEGSSPTQAVPEIKHAQFPVETGVHLDALQKGTSASVPNTADQGPVMSAVSPKTADHTADADAEDDPARALRSWFKSESPGAAPFPALNQVGLHDAPTLPPAPQQPEESSSGSPESPSERTSQDSSPAQEELENDRTRYHEILRTAIVKAASTKGAVELESLTEPPPDSPEVNALAERTKSSQSAVGSDEADRTVDLEREFDEQLTQEVELESLQRVILEGTSIEPPSDSEESVLQSDYVAKSTVGPFAAPPSHTSPAEPQDAPAADPISQPSAVVTLDEPEPREKRFREPLFVAEIEPPEVTEETELPTPQEVNATVLQEPAVASLDQVEDEESATDSDERAYDDASVVEEPVQVGGHGTVAIDDDVDSLELVEPTTIELHVDTTAYDVPTEDEFAEPDIGEHEPLEEQPVFDTQAFDLEDLTESEEERALAIDLLDNTVSVFEDGIVYNEEEELLADDLLNDESDSLDPIDPTELLDTTELVFHKNRLVFRTPGDTQIVDAKPALSALNSASSDKEGHEERDIGSSEAEQLRRDPRNYLMVRLPVTELGSKARTGHLRDITERGLQLTGFSCEVGELIRLRIETSEFSDVEPFSFIAECRWTKKEGRVAGFLIKEISPQDLDRLRELIRFLSL